MTTKESTLRHKENYFIVNESTNDQFKNFNLNANSQFSSKAFSKSSKNVSPENKKAMDYDFAKNDSNLWKKSTKKFPLNFGKPGDNSEKELKMGQNPRPKNTNKSIISLHIEAYENTIIENAGKIKESSKQNFLIPINAKQNFIDSPIFIQNSFEFLRQQETNEAKMPEVAQYKTSQQLLNPNQMDQQCPFYLNVEPSNRITFMGDWLKELTTTLKITNKSDSKQAFKVKCTRNDLFRIRPPSGILDFNASVEIQLFFKPTGSKPESDKHHVGIYHIPAPEGATAIGAWAEHYGPPQGEKRLKICFENN